MHEIKKLFPHPLKNLYHLLQAILANILYGFPSRKLKVIGVTGTDGKTTTVQMITKILEESGKNVAMASTINFRINRQETKNLSHFTTTSTFSLQKFISKAVKEGSEYLVLETSSHSLDQHRVWGVQYHTAVITNVTREHLDYHKTIEKYRKAKKMLFENVSKNSGTLIVNLDMEKPEDFLNFEDVKKFCYTTRTDANCATSNVEIVQAKNIELLANGSKYEILNTKYKIHLPGLFNIENALSATCVGLSENISMEKISEALKKIEGVPGRMESIANNRDLNIIVDFALTPNALERLYSLYFSIKNNSKIIGVFGSCGERDRGKRPIMGETVSKYADYIVLTNDEPYGENPLKIIEEISKGITDKKENETFWKITDRREAIKKALQISNAGDTIIVTGMGNFETMVVGNKKIPWNDRQVIEEELQNMA